MLGLSELAERFPSDLCHGQRKLVGVARALAADPKLVLLDEPAAGLDTAESQLLGAHLREFLADGMTVFLIDHDMGLVLNVCDYIYVLDFGRSSPTARRRRCAPTLAVIAAYLGESAGEAQARARCRLQQPSASGDGATLDDRPADRHRRPARRLRRHPGRPRPDLHVDAGEVVALLGPNGAGKTTTLLTISGLLRPIQGSVRVLGEEVDGRAPVHDPSPRPGPRRRGPFAVLRPDRAGEHPLGLTTDRAKRQGRLSTGRWSCSRH